MDHAPAHHHLLCTQTCTHHHTPIAYTPAHESPRPLHTRPSQQPPLSLPMSTNVFAGDIDVGLAHDEQLNAFVVVGVCRDVHWSPALLWAHNTTHGRESVRHCMAPKGTRHGCTNKGQCGYGWTLYVVMHCALYEGMRVSHHHTPIASTPAHQSPYQHHHVPAAHPPIPTPAIATTRVH